MDSTNEEKETMEERFDKQFPGMVFNGEYDAKLYVKDFINQELQSLVADMLGKKIDIKTSTLEYSMVKVENILQIARERGIKI